ncbi:MAG: SDR family oxidoreductase [Deltaproteobacteria bacterium]|nr:SDR family oxidoreductase [Deltaproteobacteria bacterium]
MMSVFVFGAARGAGRCVARLATAQGTRAGAMVRSEKARDELAEIGVAVVLGDALDAHACRRALEESGPWDAVISTMGGGEAAVDRIGICNAIDAASASGVRRFVLTSSLGVGSSRPFASARLVEAIGPTLLAKEDSEKHLVASGLAWTIVRPGMLLSTPATGGGVLDEDPSLHGSLTREDLAALLLACAGDPGTHGRIFGAVDHETRRYGRVT